MLPSTRDEHWKYAPLRALQRRDFTSTPSLQPEALARLIALAEPAATGFTRLAFIDGRQVSSLSSPSPKSIRIERIDKTERDSGEIDRRFAELNAAHASEHWRIEVPAQAELDLDVWSLASGTGHPSLALRLGRGSRVRLIERHRSVADTSTLTNFALLIDLGSEAQLDHVRLIEPCATHQHFETLEVALADAARHHLVQITHGGLASRTTALVNLAGRGAGLQWESATLAEGHEVHDTYVRVAHAAPGTHTDQMFRGIARDRARIGFDGHLQVCRAAAGAHTAQSLKALLGGTEAEANLRPQLEIDTDDVRATHGATVGKLDADMLFYLRSRGVDPATAEALLQWAFVSDVLARLPLLSLRREVERSLARQLPGAVAAGALGRDADGAHR